MHNTGDVDMQFLCGAFGTGTHGSGKTLQNLSGMIKGCHMIDGKGELQEFFRNWDLIAGNKFVPPQVFVLIHNFPITSTTLIMRLMLW